MTYGEFNTLCKRKIFEDNPRRSDRFDPESDEENWLKAIVDEYASISDSKHLLTDEISDVFLLLQQELGIPMPEVHKLKSDFVLPPETTKRAERLKSLSFAEPSIKQ